MVRRSFGVGVARAINGLTGSDWPAAGFRSATWPQPETGTIAASMITRVNFMADD
jgi:hypothetical protein